VKFRHLSAHERSKKMALILEMFEYKPHTGRMKPKWSRVIGVVEIQDATVEIDGIRKAVQQHFQGTPRHRMQRDGFDVIDCMDDRIGSVEYWVDLVRSNLSGTAHTFSNETFWIDGPKHWQVVTRIFLNFKPTSQLVDMVPDLGHWVLASPSHM